MKTPLWGVFKNSRLVLDISTRLLRGRDSNPRPSGYEPDELPLLYPAINNEAIIP